ncbi:MAG: hypothetical protein IAE79_03900 [Anaerolinea sp.]|nr:hypothetical protein [Anaerolinea sp.]
MNGRWRRLIALLPVLFVLACRVVDVTPTLPPTTPTPAPPVASATQITAVVPSATMPVAATDVAATAVSATAVAPVPKPAAPASPTAPPGLPTPASGSLTIDQQNNITEGGLWGVAELGPVGQTFTPAADSLDVVVLWVATGGLAPVTLQVVVREGGLDGRILGQSQPVDIPLDFADRVSFAFVTAVSLRPGQLHTLEVTRVSSAGNGAVGWVQHAGWDDPYPNGEAIVQGQPLPQADLWFQTGRGQ